MKNYIPVLTKVMARTKPLKIILLFSCVSIVALLLFTNCKKNDDDHNNPINKWNGVMIKGKLPHKILKSMSQTSADSLSDAVKIMVFKGMKGGDMIDLSFVEIVGDSFTINAQMGNAVALIFVDANNNYIGNLSNRGLSFLPLGNLKDGENAVIDLSDLKQEGNLIYPSHDPFGNEIIINQEEINCLKELDDFMEYVAKNTDANNDHILDALISQQIFVTTHFGIEWNDGSLRFGLNNKPPFINDSVSNKIKYSLEIFGDTGFTYSPGINFSGPQANPYADYDPIWSQPLHSPKGFRAGVTRRFYQPVNSRPPFEKGIYTLTIGGLPYTIYYSNYDAKNNLLIAAPTLYTDSNGLLTSISLDYFNPQNNNITPENIIVMVGVQLSGGGSDLIAMTPWLVSYSPGGYGQNLSHGLYSYTFPAPVNISRLHHVHVEYRDILGNMYVCDWMPPK